MEPPLVHQQLGVFLLLYYSTVLSKEDDSLDQMYSQVLSAPVKSNHPTASNVEDDDDDDDDPADPKYDHIQRYSQEDMGQSCHIKQR